MPGTSLRSLLGPDIQSANTDRVWYFGFCQGHPRSGLAGWMKWFMRNDPPHLGHVYAFTQVGDYILFVEPTVARVDYVLKYPTENAPVMSAEFAAQELADFGHIVVRHRYTPHIGGKKSIWNWIPSCVTVVKCATGYASTSWTPKHLLHSLIRDGAHVFLKGEQEICLKSSQSQSPEAQAPSN